MKDLISYLTKRHFIKLGDYSFSPILEASAGISLEYCEKIQKGECEKNPLFFCFPEKKGASLWTSIAILNNYFYSDHIDNVVDGINFFKGEKVKIFNCIAEVEKSTKNKVFLKFKDQGGIPINKRLRPQLSKVNSNRQLSLKKKFAKNYKEAKTERNPISKILEPKDSIRINENNLNSKVLLISGRGNVVKFNELLNSIKIYDESLSKIYPEKKNLIITPNLNSFKNIFSKDVVKDFEDFLKIIEKLYDLITIDDAKLFLKKITTKLVKEQKITNELDNEILSFFRDYETVIPQIKFVEKKYPGLQELLPEKLRAVVINDINQVYEYPDTIKGFLHKNIPVIFISNRNVDKTSDIEFYQRLFKDNGDYYRLNWNKVKIRSLPYSNEIKYIDSELWEQCNRYINQEIQLKVTPEDNIDVLAPRILKYIQELEGFEILQKAFYNFFYPGLYALKNSKQPTEKIRELISEFQEIFDKIKPFGMPHQVVQDIEETIRIAKNFSLNSKNYGFKNIFSQTLPTHIHKNFYIPVESVSCNIPSSTTNVINFTGYPYNEYSEKYLRNAACVHFVPKITVHCWPYEATMTYKYLKRRIKAGYFTDYLGEIFSIKKIYLLKEEKDFDNEIDSFFHYIASFKSEEDTYEQDLEYLHTFRYKGYSTNNGGENLFKVKCSILNFEDGSFMFLPKQSRILAQVENDEGKTKISQVSFKDLSAGFKIFKYQKDRITYRAISKNDERIEKNFYRLELWKTVLEKLFKDCGKDLNALENILQTTKDKFNLKGNPVKASIQRWLFDDEIIKPDTENLRIIFTAAKCPEIEENLVDLDEAFKKVLSYTIGLSTNIKKNIALQLSSKEMTEENFIVNIKGSKINVESRTIVAIDDNEIEVDYHHTRKILC